MNANQIIKKMKRMKIGSIISMLILFAIDYYCKTQIMNYYIGQSDDIKDVHKLISKLYTEIETLKNNFDIDKTGKADLALSSIGGKIAGSGSNTKFVHDCNFIWNNSTIFIRLSNEAVLESVTIEHITKKLSPTGEVTEAPKTFSVSGMNSELEEPFHFGTFIFNANKSSIETFKFKTKSSIAFRYIKVDFHENNGDPNSTCVYRLRVHGVVLKSK